jgi:predicted MPP superfamily phosphohydrolase
MVSRAGKALAASLGGALAWSLLAPFRLVVEHHEAPVPALPENWQGRRLALLSDLHIGLPSANEAISRRAVSRILEEKPDLALLAGDFVHDTHAAIAPAVALVRPLVDAGIPTYAVLGNHDYAMPSRGSRGDRCLARELERELRSAGITVLSNDVVELKREGDREPLYLVGVAPHTPREDRPAEALERLPDGAPRLVLMHHPASFDACPAHSAPFAMAGHTHGGQVRLPLAPFWRYMTYIKEVKVFVSGWIESGMIERYGKEGNRLYVSRGVGCSVAPVRLFSPPELTFFTLTRPS